MTMGIKEGDVSEWNEGTLKSLRLHQAQVLINTAKINPLSKVMDMWGHLAWFKGVDILLGEGMEKYADSELDEIIKLKKEIEKIIDEKPICTPINSSGRQGVSVNINNWKELKPKLEFIEYKVKFYNNKHGLSTRNVGTKGLF